MSKRSLLSELGRCVLSPNRIGKIYVFSLGTGKVGEAKLSDANIIIVKECPGEGSLVIIGLDQW